ncbi:hypothetical protein N7478_008018 [Penicillium angulare]|uniref:uncharacterized protein n=1 Tax=Penicillium angulare TaxID=116970 RepID=UPI0025425DCC|nr:uncharacterized protein N7478_008018 [Penicillium angulare]KAJ5272893.1 hypothetical protein N7478_008018 [Penicillium angulare]
MARAMTVTKTRNVQDDDTISFPVLTYTDAEPRHDLQDIHISGSQHHSNENVTQWDFPRPKAAEGRSSRKPPPPSIGATFDFQLTAPPDEIIPLSARSARSPIGLHTIGVALGSPGILGSHNELPPPRFNASVHRSEQSPQLGKSRWKKIGGLFKAKNALALPTTNADGTTVNGEVHSKDKANTNPNKTKKEEATEEWPKIEVESKSSGDKNTPAKRSRKFSFSNKKSFKEKNGDVSPMLELNIPDVQMERYSVMFSNVMTKNQRPSLLARRSKTLDHLRVPSSNDFITTSKAPPVPQRRATSPARSSFTLFPTSQPSKAAQVLGTQNFSRGPSPLMRSNTLPVESPSKVSHDQPRPFANNNSLSSFESPVIANLFTESCNTPQSYNGSIRRDEKPLPAIKPERPAAPPRSQTSSPQVPPKPSQAPTHTNNLNTNKKPTEQKHSRSHQQPTEIRHKTHPTDIRPTDIRPTDKARPAPIVKSSHKTPPKPPAKDSTSVSHKPSPTNIPIKSKSMDDVSRINSPAKIAPQLTVRTPSKIAAGLVITEREIKSPESYTNKKLPKIEVSTARSISVSKGRKQMLVPIASRVDQLHPSERLVERRAMTPTITDVQYGHRHAVSQELQIESM